MRVDRLHDAVVAVRAQRGHDHVRDDRRVDARGDLESARGRRGRRRGEGGGRRGERRRRRRGRAGRGFRGRTGQLSMSQKIPSGATFASIVVGEASRGAREGCSSFVAQLCAFRVRRGRRLGGAAAAAFPRARVARRDAATPRRRDGRGGSRCARGRGVKWGGGRRARVRRSRRTAAREATKRGLSDLKARLF